MHYFVQALRALQKPVLSHYAHDIHWASLLCKYSHSTDFLSLAMEQDDSFKLEVM